MTERISIPRADYDELMGIIAVIEVNGRSVPEASLPGPEVSRPVAGDDAHPQADASFAFADYGKFYDWLRADKMLGPSISSTEFEGCDRIIRACALVQWPVSHVAYALATTYHETAHTMQPIQELGGHKYFTRMYDIEGNRPRKARELGNLTPGDGAKYAGRGYVQLTGRTNYRKAAEKLDALGFDKFDVLNNPAAAMDPAISAEILVAGMAEGWFTGRKISDDLPSKGPATLQQFTATRDVINGTDKDRQIAAYAVGWQKGLLEGGYRIGA